MLQNLSSIPPLPQPLSMLIFLGIANSLCAEQLLKGCTFLRVACFLHKINFTIFQAGFLIFRYLWSSRTKLGCGYLFCWCYFFRSRCDGWIYAAFFLGQFHRIRKGLNPVNLAVLNYVCAETSYCCCQQFLCNLVEIVGKWFACRFRTS